MLPSDSTPWPITRQPQCSHTGASAWIAHSKLSKTCVSPARYTSKILSYSFPHTSRAPRCSPLPSRLGDLLDRLADLLTADFDREFGLGETDTGGVRPTGGGQAPR